MGEAKEMRSTSIYHRTSIKNENWRQDPRPLRPRTSRFVSKPVGSWLWWIDKELSTLRDHDLARFGGFSEV